MNSAVRLVNRAWELLAYAEAEKYSGAYCYVTIHDDDLMAARVLEQSGLVKVVHTKGEGWQIKRTMEDDDE